MTEADLLAWANRTNEIAAGLLKAQPDLNPITAQIIAGDLLSAERTTKEVNDGADAEKVYFRVGSYARWDWVVTMVRAGKISATWFAENICDLWRGADPDDTNLDYLNIWKVASMNNKGATIRDGRRLPKARPDGTILVYRGGPITTVRGGFAWTTDPKIAKKFALGAGSRVPMDGVVIQGTVKPSMVLAYITKRHEAEVIVDPTNVRDVLVIG